MNDGLFTFRQFQLSWQESPFAVEVDPANHPWQPGTPGWDDYDQWDTQ